VNRIRDLVVATRCAPSMSDVTNSRITHQGRAAQALFGSGDSSAVAPPVPIPNTEVKRCSPDGSTAIGRVRVGRRQSKNPAGFPVGFLVSGTQVLLISWLLAASGLSRRATFRRRARFLRVSRGLILPVESANSGAMPDEKPSRPQPVPRTAPPAICSLLLAIFRFFAVGSLTTIPAAICGHYRSFENSQIRWRTWWEGSGKHAVNFGLHRTGATRDNHLAL
jgi:hypothetical protein